MLTPQEVSGRVFNKAVMGGYNMSMVDEFLDELTEDYTALYKENAALKTKLKVMVDKVEDYRATEDSMRSALLAAQKMAEAMVADAEQKKAELLKDVDAAVQKRHAELADEIADQEQKLERAKQELARFLENARKLCQDELALLERIPQEDLRPAEKSSPTVEEKQTEAAEEIEESILSSFNRDFSFVSSATQETPAQEEPAFPEAETQEAEEAHKSSGDSIFDEFQTTRRINLNELKFGRNYNNSDN